jgi:hypothetical protein
VERLSRQDSTIFIVEVEVTRSGIGLDLLALCLRVSCAARESECTMDDVQHTFTSHWPALKEIRALVAMVMMDEFWFLR